MNVPPLRVGLAYNLRTDRKDEDQAERLDEGYIDDVDDALSSLGHDVDRLEVSGSAPEVFQKLARADVDIVFNIAEGEEGVWREALYPILYEFLGMPYTGAGPGVLGMCLDKRLTEEAVALRGVHVPRGRLVTPDDPGLDGLEPPLLIKPNFEGSSMGIHQESVVRDLDEAKKRVKKMLKEFPAGLDVEEYIEGREITIGYLEGLEERFTKTVEYRFPEDREAIMDYETKMEEGKHIETLSPAPLSDDDHDAVMEAAARTVSALRLPDCARMDLRLRDGEVSLIEVNPLPGLRDVSPLTVGANASGLSYEEIIGTILGTAAARYGLTAEVSEAMV